MSPSAVTVALDPEDPVEFTVTNIFELGDVAVMKVVDGPGAAFATGPFEVELSCTFENTPIDLGEDAVRVLSPEECMTGSWSGLPMGAECGLTETEDGGATYTDVSPSAVTVGADTEGPVAFTVTNTFELGHVGVTKVIEGPGAAFAAGPFEMELACTFEGTEVWGSRRTVARQGECLLEGRVINGKVSKVHP